MWKKWARIKCHRDRWKVLRNPFLPGAVTRKKCLLHLVLIWTVSAALAMPEIVALTTVTPPELPVDTVLFTQCAPTWSERVEGVYLCTRAALLFVAPTFFMVFAYCRVLRRLNAMAQAEARSLGTFSVMRLSQLHRRLEVTRMLLSLSIVYILTYAPAYLVGVVKFALGNDVSISADARVSVSLLIHWFCYLNAAVNPFIYSLMCDRFRQLMAQGVRDVLSRCCICSSLCQESQRLPAEPYVITSQPPGTPDLISCSLASRRRSSSSSTVSTRSISVGTSNLAVDASSPIAESCSSWRLKPSSSSRTVNADKSWRIKEPLDVFFSLYPLIEEEAAHETLTLSRCHHPPAVVVRRFVSLPCVRVAGGHQGHGDFCYPDTVPIMSNQCP